MDLRTFYWQPETDSRRFGRTARFRYGNAGDSFNIDLAAWRYPDHQLVNDGAETGGRLLMVGSTGHRALDGDVLSGVGLKQSELPARDGRDLSIHGLRGPMSVDAFERAGYDTASVRFLGDPGLLIGEVFPRLGRIEPSRGRVSYLPHYREKDGLRSDRRRRIIDIDAPALEVGRRIARSEAVLSSSLHGIIWAHALGRPVRPVGPPKGEAAFKYHDYFASIGAAYLPAASVDEALREPIPAVPEGVRAVIEGIALPDAGALRSRGVLR